MKLNVVKTSNQRHPLSDLSNCCDSCEQYNEETETCEWCRFDLDHSGMIDPDDLDTPVWNKCWARIILTGNPDYEECLACNFDDVFGGSGVGDPMGMLSVLVILVYGAVTMPRPVKNAVRIVGQLLIHQVLDSIKISLI